MNSFKNIVIWSFVSISVMISLELNAQSFMPSQQQIEQFKNLPRSQQEQLAQQMGFDISILENSQSINADETDDDDEIEFVERDLDHNEVSNDLSEQSVVGEETKKLKAFGHSIFESRSKATKPIKNVPVPTNYVIGPGDSFNLQLFGKETGSYKVAVDSNGNIELPELGPLSVSGVNFRELKNLVQENYKQQKIGVTPYISMGELRTLQIFLVGEVFRPGPIIVSGMSTITSALINSGGINSIGSLRSIQLKRDGKIVSNFDLYALIVNGDTSKDLRLEQGDVIFVPTAKNIVTLDGAVRRPAIYELLDGEDINSLLNLAGGLLPTANSRAVQLVRNVPNEGLTLTTLNTATQSDLNNQLINGDYVKVPEATLEFQNAILISGAINSPRILAYTPTLTLANIVKSETLLSHTDLRYGLVVRKHPYAVSSTIIQFEPLNIVRGIENIKLEPYDEIIIFNNLDRDTVLDNESETEIDLSKSKLQEETVEVNSKTEEVDSAYSRELNRFTVGVLSIEADDNMTREKLLAPLISRLKREASDDNPLQIMEVKGQVKFPGLYPITQTNSISDVLNASGGLTESAHLESAEISAVDFDKDGSDVSHKRLNITNQLLLPKHQQIKLKSKDVLSVVRIPNWYENKIVELKGEVVFPGKYQISDGETLTNLIKRAGGLTSRATVDAAVFTREELKDKEKENIDRAIDDLKQQIANSNLSNSQFSKSVDYEQAISVLDDLTDVEPLGRLVIDLSKILENDSADLTLKDGDVLTVPNITPAISVIGEVFVSATYMYTEVLDINDYVELAGGVTKYADTSKTYVVRANGAVFVPTNNFWFSATSEDFLKPGDTIVVPRNVTNYDNIGLWQGVTQIIYQSAIALVALSNV